MIRNLYLDSTDNSKLDFYLDGKRITQMYLDGVCVWDVSGDNRLTIEGYCSGYYQFKYTVSWLTYPNYNINVPIIDNNSCTWNDFTVPSGLTGTIDWGDGTIESYNSDNDYTHDYYNNACEYFLKNYKQQYGSVYFKITITFDTDIVAIINPSFFNAGYNRIIAIHFPDSCKYLSYSMSFDNLFNDIPITLNVPTSMEIMTCYPSQNQKTITHFEIPNNVKYLGLDKYFCGGFDESYYTTGAFQNCKSLTTINIPKSVKLIGSLCFHNCSNLQSITGLDGVEVFGYDCFNTCDNLEPFPLPSTTKYILAQSFDMVGNQYYGYDAHDFYIDQPRTSYLDFNCNSPLDIYEIPNSCIFIGHRAFSTCYWFRILSLPNTIQYLAENFYISGFAVCELIYRGTTSEWFTIKFTETDAQSYTNIDDFFSTKQIADKNFYKSMSDQIRRIICDDGIIINPYASGYFSDGTEYTGYGDNCFNENGNAIKENFLILNQ
ncbi:MAG: leucine-rich repeat domain-containing protein [Oscillospiraceae bacterium]